MPTLTDIRHPIEDHIAHYEDFVSRILQSDSEYVSTICNYVLSKRGKQMRPILVLLSAALHGPISEDTYVGAALIEMVHSASLIHDDVIDQSSMRRGAPSVNAMWNSHVAVIAGDYILARTFHKCVEMGRMELIKEVTQALYEVTEGELIQTDQTEKLTMTEEIYYDIIAKKTASLISACATVGAMSANASPTNTEAMRMFGKYLGMAFQIKDDILDYSSSDITGKPTCGDIRERKITLPLLFVLNNATEAERGKILAMMAEDIISSENIDYIYRTVIDGGGLEYAAGKMVELKEKALGFLTDYEPSETLEGLKMFAQYSLQREK